MSYVETSSRLLFYRATQLANDPLVTAQVKWDLSYFVYDMGHI